jgi:hypothetical protein
MQCETGLIGAAPIRRNLREPVQVGLHQRCYIQICFSAGSQIVSTCAGIGLTADMQTRFVEGYDGEDYPARAWDLDVR